jgi:4-amino-4-deoxy-L-arabinose transferase-like glycosyltransferase
MTFRPIPRDYVLLWGILVLTGLYFRPLTPVDETRAASVAWEMWQRGDFLVPHLNGETYSHKPPLLQWGIHLGWLLAGVSDWTTRLVAPLFGLANLLLAANLARRLWPDRPDTRALAPLILLSFPVWAVWTTLTLYDMLVAFFTLLGLLGIWRSAQGEIWAGRLLTGLAIGGGVLSKGPVILLLILPAGLLAPWWMERRPERGWPNCYLGLLGSVLLGALLALAWAIPAGIAGGEEYRHAIFWGQSAGRIAHSFAHRRPFWWYGAVLPILLFPWAFRLSLWRSRPWPTFKTDAGLKFCLAHLAAVTLLLSLVSGKQVHYLLPVLPAAALILARLLPESAKPFLGLDQRLLGGLLAVLALGLMSLPMAPGAGGEVGRMAAAAPLPAKLAILATGLILVFRRPGTSISSLRGTAYALIVLVVAAHPIYWESNRPRYDMQPLGSRLADLQAQGAPVAHWGKYSGDFQFTGRLNAPLEVLLDGREMGEWLAAHPEGYIVIVSSAKGTEAENGADFTREYRGSRRRAELWKASVLNADPMLLSRLIRNGKKAEADDAVPNPS